MEEINKPPLVPKRLHAFLETPSAENRPLGAMKTEILIYAKDIKKTNYDKTFEMGGLKAVVLQAKQFVDDGIKLDLDRGVHVDCKAGCNICCRIEVGVTKPEMDAVLGASNGKHLEFKGHLIKQYEAKSLSELPPDDASCVFLSPEGCSIYEDRPIPCRLYHSKSIVHCIERGTYEPVTLLYAEAAYWAYLEFLNEKDLLNPNPDNILHRQLYLDTQKKD